MKVQWHNIDLDTQVPKVRRVHLHILNCTKYRLRNSESNHVTFINPKSINEDSRLRGLALISQLRRLRTFDTYQDNWDGEGAPKPRKDAIWGANLLLISLFRSGHAPYHSLPSVAGGMIVHTIHDGFKYRFVIESSTTISSASKKNLDTRKSYRVSRKWSMYQLNSLLQQLSSVHA